MMRRNCLFLTLVLLLGMASAASAQGFVTDARIVAMGGGGGNSPNIAKKMVPAKGRAEMVIPIPLGLIHVFQGGFDKFKPSSDKFDPLAAVESAGNLLYYRFGADTSDDSPRRNYINDLVNGTVDPNLAVYAGFDIPESSDSEGLLAPQFGKTFKFIKADDRFHGLYIGVGPYLSYRAATDVDPRLVDIFGNGATYPNASMPLLGDGGSQVAGALTAGYRGRLPMGTGGNAERDGVYLAYNFHFLKGFKYYEPDLEIRFTTNGQGLLIPSGTPFSLASVEAGSGSGFASDIGIQIVRGNIEGGFGINGIGNRINWSDFTKATYTLPNLTTGLEFTKTDGTSPYTELRVKLPVVKTANIGFEYAGWGATATATDGYNGKSFSGGVERNLGPIWVRGGGRYAREHWDPTAGVGFGTNVAVDIALFGTHANFQDERQWALAASVRIGR